MHPVSNFKEFLRPALVRLTGSGTKAKSVLLGLSVVFLFLYVFPHLAFLQHANEMPRLFLAEEMARTGSFHVDTGMERYSYRKVMDLSRSLCLGSRVIETLSRSLARKGFPGQKLEEWPCKERHYSNKAPGQSMLAVPFLKVAQLLSGKKDGATLAQRLWWVRLGTSVLPTLALLLTLSFTLKRYVFEDLPRISAVLAYGLGSLAMAFSLQFMSHQLAAALVFGAFALIDSRSTPSTRLLAFSGLLSGMAIAADYQAAFAVLIVASYAFLRTGLKPRILVGAAFGLAPLLLLLYYHHRCFGWPLWTGYEFLLDPADQVLHDRGVLGMVGPGAKAFWGSFFSARDGLLFLSPWLLTALPGFALMLASSRTAGPAAPIQREGCPFWISAASFWSWAGFGLGAAAMVLAISSPSTRNPRWIEGQASLLNALGGLLLLWAAAGHVCLSWLKGFRQAARLRIDEGGTRDLLLGSLLVALGLAAPVLAGIAPSRIWIAFMWLSLPMWTHLTIPARETDDRSKVARITTSLALAACTLFYLAGGLLPLRLDRILRLLGWVASGAWALAALRPGPAHARAQAEAEEPPAVAVPSAALVCFALVVFYTWFISSVTFWHGGWQAGPRYVSVMLPFMTIPAAVAFGHLYKRGLAWSIPAGLTIASMTVYTLTAATFPHFPKSFTNPFFDLVGYLLARGYVARNLGQLLNLKGTCSLLPYLAVAALLGIYVACGRAAFGAWRKGNEKRLLAGLFAFLICVFLLSAMSRVPKTDFGRCCSWITRMWDKERDAAAGKSHGRLPRKAQYR